MEAVLSRPSPRGLAPGAEKARRAGRGSHQECSRSRRGAGVAPTVREHSQHPGLENRLLPWL